MKCTVTSLEITVRITGYNEAGKVAWRPPKPIQFEALESAIPDSTLEWIRSVIGMQDGQLPE